MSEKKKDTFGFKNMTFQEKKFSALDGKTKIFLIEMLDPDLEQSDPWTVSITPTGVSFMGTMHKEIEDHEDLQCFAKFLDDVWRKRAKLKTKIIAPGVKFKPVPMGG